MIAPKNPTCASTIKACGFKSVKEVADLACLNASTLRRWFLDGSPKFRQALLIASRKRSGILAAKAAEATAKAKAAETAMLEIDMKL